MKVLGMRGKTLIGVIVLLFLSGPTYAWEKSIINIPGYNNNIIDTHMHWDGEYLWIPETEAEHCPSLVISSNLIRYNPLTEEVVNYPLPYSPEQSPNVYEVVPGSNPDTLYISAPYGKDKAIYIFNKSTGLSTQYTAPSMFLGFNGAKMAVTGMDNGTDYVWTTGIAGYIVKFNANDQTSESFNFSSLGGFYGIAAVPTDTPNVWTIFAASLTTGNLLMFPSNISDVNDPNITVVNIGEDLGVSPAILTSMHYDGTDVWIAIKSDFLQMHGFVRYLPSTTPGEVGDYDDFWAEDAVYVGAVPTMTDFKGHMWMTIENFLQDCDYVEDTEAYPQLVVIDKSIGAIETVPLPEFVELNRAAASLGNDNESIYVGGYGYNAEGSVLNLLKVHPQSLHPDIIHGEALGAVQEEIPIEIYKPSCGTDILVDSTITDSEGHFLFDSLEDGRYLISIDYNNNSIRMWADIPQVEIKSYDFIVSED